MSGAPVDTATPIAAVGLVKRYGGVTALAGTDFSVHPGEVVGLVGKNGAGKSTLIKVLAGATQPDEGGLLVDGAPVHFRTPHDSTKHGLAFVHQELADAPQLSVCENLLLGHGYPRRLGLFVDWRGARRRAQEALAALDDRIDPAATLGELSVAQRRVVKIAAALLQDARVVVLDEPTAALTATEIEHLHGVIRLLSGRGIGIVYVSHRLPEIFELASRIVVMRDGRVVRDCPAAELDMPTLVTEIAGAEVAREQQAPPPRPAQAGPVLLAGEGLSAGRAVRGVGLELRAGEVLGIAGLVGAGRTETLRLLAGADRPSGGRLLVDGEEVSFSSPRAAIRRGIVLLPEDRRHQGLVMDMSIGANITLTALSDCRRWRSVPVPSSAREDAVAGGQRSALQIKTDSVRRLVSSLSGGNQQKVVLGKWLTRGAKVFLFDEPTAGIDVTGRAEIYDRIRGLAEEGHGVIVVSSDFSEFPGLCHRVLVMREGELAGELVGDSITESRIVAACYERAAAVQQI